jgi:hypothetical protein
MRETAESRTHQSLKGDPKIYSLLERSGLFPKESLPGYDCVSRALAAALYLYKKTGELSEIYNLKMKVGEVDGPSRPDVMFQTYLVHKYKPYCYPVTWHEPIFPELGVEEIKQRSKFGEISGVMVGSLWHSMTGDRQIVEVFDKYQPKDKYGIKKVLGIIIYRGDLKKGPLAEQYQKSIYEKLMIKMRKQFPELLTPKPRRKLPQLRNVMSYVSASAERDGWNIEGLNKLRVLIASHTIKYCPLETYD